MYTQALAFVGAGGAVGAILRYAVSLAVHRHLGDAFPWGTLVVNVSGCLCIGVAWAIVEELPTSQEARLFFVTGILGAVTTFSTFGLETIQLISDGRLASGLANVVGSNLAGLVAVGLGIVLGRVLFAGFG